MRRIAEQLVRKLYNLGDWHGSAGVRSRKGFVMRRPGLCLSLLFPFFCLHSQSGRSVLGGDVVNATTNAPLPGARLRLEMANDVVLYAKAERDGHFLFGNLTGATGQLTVESPGFLQMRICVHLCSSVARFLLGVASGLAGRVAHPQR